MNDETIDFRLGKIEEKLDTLIDIQMQTQAQEIRLSNLEGEVKEMKDEATANKRSWLNPLISAVVSGFVAFVFVKIGLH
jgi:hypothetical protein